MHYFSIDNISVGLFGESSFVSSKTKLTLKRRYWILVDTPVFKTNGIIKVKLIFRPLTTTELSTYGKRAKV